MNKSGAIDPSTGILSAAGVAVSSYLGLRERTAYPTGSLRDRGWPKIHTLSDIDSGEIIAYALTDGSVGYSHMLIVLAETAL
ncbi:MAG: hypothetical protein VB016_05825 [Methanomassiliicoccaceae archaeon]|nr:hypothetical protein [Methanomassiliicoccaceae archaeon]